MIDRFPYNLPSRVALVVLIRRLTNRPNLKDEDVSFEDIFFSPTEVEPGRTYIEMVDRSVQYKDWFVFRRLNLADPACLGNELAITIVGDPTPAAIAREINRSMGMTFGPDDISFSEEYIPVSNGNFNYELRAMTGSYAYFGVTTINVKVVQSSRWNRYLQDGLIRYLQDGTPRQLEH